MLDLVGIFFLLLIIAETCAYFAREIVLGTCSIVLLFLDMGKSETLNGTYGPIHSWFDWTMTVWST